MWWSRWRVVRFSVKKRTAHFLGPVLGFLRGEKKAFPQNVGDYDFYLAEISWDVLKSSWWWLMADSTNLMDVVMDDYWLPMLRINQITEKWNEWMRQPRDGLDTNVMNCVHVSWVITHRKMHVSWVYSSIHMYIYICTYHMHILLATW